MANMPMGNKSAWSGKPMPGMDNNAKRPGIAGPGMQQGLNPGANAKALQAMLPMPSSMGQQRSMVGQQRPQMGQQRAPMAAPTRQMQRPVQQQMRQQARPMQLPQQSFQGIPQLWQQQQQTPISGTPTPPGSMQQAFGMQGSIPQSMMAGTAADAFYADGGEADQQIAGSTTGTVVDPQTQGYGQTGAAETGTGGTADGSFKTQLEQAMWDAYNNPEGIDPELLAQQQAEARDSVSKDYAQQQWEMSQQLGARGMGMSGAYLTGRTALSGQRTAAMEKAARDLWLQDEKLKAQKESEAMGHLASFYGPDVQQQISEMQAEKAYEIWEKEFGPNLAAQGRDMAIAAKKAGYDSAMAQRVGDEWVQKWTGEDTNNYVGDAFVPQEVAAQKPLQGQGTVQDNQGNMWIWDGYGWMMVD